MCALPASRDFDAVDGGPLPAATVNNIQDAIVALEAARIAIVGPRTIQQPAISAFSQAANLTYLITDDRWLLSVTGLAITYPIYIPVGANLTSWALSVEPTSAGNDATASLFRSDVATPASAVIIGSAQTSAGFGASEDIGEVLGAPHVVLAAQRLYITTSGTRVAGAGSHFGLLRYTYDLT